MTQLSVQVLDFAAQEGDTIATNRVVLDRGGPSYRIRLRWLPQPASWILDIATTAGIVIVSGAWVRDRTDCLLGVSTVGRPRGAILAYDAKGRGDPGRYAWTKDGVSLLYVPSGFDPTMFSLYPSPVV